MVYDNTCVGDGAVFGDVPDFVIGEKKIVLVPTVVSSFPCASQWSSLDIAGTQSGLRTGSFMSLVYFVIVSLVTGCTTPLYTSLMLILWRMRLGNSERACGIVYVGGELNARLMTW
jgi:hypothetical protein